ncbi:MAG: BamA/TamA family outer membrane protein [Deltaproteobacteria bacterium]|nr:BamA/TamA family outer membrane protein [Deltaproteobacteria bacterium]
MQVVASGPRYVRRAHGRPAGLAIAVTIVGFVVVASSLATAQPAPADAPAEPQRIVGFRVRGDSKLTERTLGYLAHVKIGDRFSPDELPRIVRNLLSSELFEEVEVALEQAPGGLLLVATLDDKHSWFVAPTLSLVAGKRAFGLGFIENNLTGRNQKLLLYGQLGDRESLFFGTYLDPSVGGSPLTYRFDLYAYRRVSNEYANPVDDPTDDTILRSSTTTYLGGGLLVGWTMRWWLVVDLRLRGAYVSFTDAQAPDGTPLPVPQHDGYDISLQTRITLDARHYHFGVRWGPYLQLQTDTSVPGLDDYGYSWALLRAYYSWRLFTEHQFELRTLQAIGRNMPFHNDWTLGGMSDLRGYATDRFRGDVRSVFRVEYSLPIAKWKYFAFRAIGFWDSGFIGRYFPRSEADRDYLGPITGREARWWRNDVGGGLRIYVKRVVLPLLGLDVSYGIESEAPQLTFQIGLTDF